MPYRDEVEALQARLMALEAERDEARAEAERLKQALLLRANTPRNGRTPELLPRPDAALRSIPGGAPTSVTLVNESPRKLEVLWLSYDGRERSAGTLVPGGRIHTQSYVGHCWRIVDALTGEILEHCHVGGDDPVITYRE